MNLTSKYMQVKPLGPRTMKIYNETNQFKIDQIERDYGFDLARIKMARLTTYAGICSNIAFALSGVYLVFVKHNYLFITGMIIGFVLSIILSFNLRIVNRRQRELDAKKLLNLKENSEVFLDKIRNHSANYSSINR